MPRNSRGVPPENAGNSALGNASRTPPDFHATPRDVATGMYYTGLDLFTKKKVYVARQLKDRKLQRARMQCFKPEHYFAVREALLNDGIG